MPVVRSANICLQEEKVSSKANYSLGENCVLSGPWAAHPGPSVARAGSGHCPLFSLLQSARYAYFLVCFRMGTCKILLVP